MAEALIVGAAVGTGDNGEYGVLTMLSPTAWPNSRGYQADRVYCSPQLARSVSELPGLYEVDWQPTGRIYKGAPRMEIRAVRLVARLELKPLAVAK